MRKQHPFDFEKWDKYLAEAEDVSVDWIAGDHMITYPNYDKRMVALAQAFEWSDFYDQNFDRTLHQKAHDQLLEENVDLIARTSHDFRELSAVTSVVIHGEVRLEGLWAAMLEKGILRRLLQRLQSQIPDDFPGPNY